MLQGDWSSDVCSSDPSFSPPASSSASSAPSGFRRWAGCGGGCASPRSEERGVGESVDLWGHFIDSTNLRGIDAHVDDEGKFEFQNAPHGKHVLTGRRL